MAAIFGLLGDEDASLLPLMGARLNHRGVIGAEQAVDRRVHLGTRVSVPPAPLVSQGSLTLAADLSLFNPDELRERLGPAGPALEGAGAEALVVAGFAALGLAVFALLNGDFALAIWDAARSVLTLARDPLGMRPLYFWQGEDRLAFASEYKALLALPFVPAQADRQAVQELQHARHAPANRTLLKDIHAVPPGHVLEYRHATPLSQHRYWQLDLALEPLAEADAVATVRREVLAAVERRVADLDAVGVALSSGIDSATVAAAIRQVRPDLPLHTFTSGHGPNDRDIVGAAVTAAALNTEHHPLYVSPDRIPELVPALVWHLEDPIARSDTAFVFETARVASAHVSVLLGGDGADSLFGGMPRHKLLRVIELAPWLRGPLEELFQYATTSTPPRSLGGRLLQYAHYRGHDVPPPTVAGAQAPTPAALPRVERELLNQVLRDGFTPGAPRWPQKPERLLMAHGVSLRTPYTDPRLIRRAFTVSDHLKLRGWREKHLLREAARPWLPLSVSRRPKGIQTQAYNRAFSDMLEALAGAYLNAEALRARGFFDKQTIDRLLLRQAGKPYLREQAERIWTAILTEAWAQAFLDRRGQPVWDAAGHSPTDRLSVGSLITGEAL